MSRRRLLQEMDSAELTWWLAYDEAAGPIGDHRGDRQAGVVASAILATRGLQVEPEAYIQHLRPEPPPDASPDPHALHRKFHALTHRHRTA